MKKTLLSLVIATSFLVGCSSAPSSQQQTADAQKTVVQKAPLTHLSALTWQPVSVPQELDFNINNQNQRLNSDSIQSTVVAYSFPANIGAIKFRLDSYVVTEDLDLSTVYVPNVVILDQNNKVLETIDSKNFEYKKAKLFNSNRLSGDFTFTPTTDMTELKVLIYTTKQDLATTTQLFNPREDTDRNYGNLPMPSKASLTAHHVETGKLYLSADPLNKVIIQQAEPVKVTPPKPVQNETKLFYTSAIQQAVADNQIEKAMSLVDEAQRLGISDAKQTFIDAVKK
ncbi:MalM family protein [Vibrio sp. SS-MA-C1-2]|uniref:MalM family protein n=1 Tax=Vibrio sp. SS-MA-C1-2 TaxID=2908646 RepID=UPI001F196243|nr:MalM family protein [Vibrio sp. SS-MA-C1-2]UJF18648.1 MalM family protein [Vibrio sp. SS-MA-C1-2]